MSSLSTFVGWLAGVVGLPVPRLRPPKTSLARVSQLYVSDLDGHVHVRHAASDVDLEAAGAGGGSDHATLSNLGWAASAHTGTASRLAGFGGGGATAYYQIGADLQGWDVDLDGYAALTGTGLVSRTGSGTATTRTIVAASAQLTVSNGDGVSGNPSIDLAYASAVRETGGPTTLTLGAVADGEWLRRSGSTVAGASSWTVATALGAGVIQAVRMAGASNIAYVYGGGVIQLQASTQADGADSTHTYRTLTSTAGDNATFGVQWGWQTGTSWDLVKTQRGPIYARFTFKTGSDITACQLWAGFFSAAFTGDEVGPADHCGITRSSVRGDANWQITSKDGTTASITDSGVACAADTRYVVDMIVTSTGIQVSINGSAYVSKTTNPATSTVALGASSGGVTASASARSHKFSSIVIAFLP